MGVSILPFLHCVLKMAVLLNIYFLYGLWGLYPSDIHCMRHLAMVCYTPNDIVHACTNTNLTCVR